MELSCSKHNETGIGGPTAIVLGLNVTGLAVVRALAENDVEVHGVSLSDHDPGRASRRCEVITLQGLSHDFEALSEWLFSYASTLGDSPVIFPTSDELALLLSQYRDYLLKVSRIWSNTYEGLKAIVSKDQLYASATEAGVRIPPSLISPQNNEIEAWCDQQSGPYIVKPFYVGAASAAIDFKNTAFEDGNSLTQFMRGRKNGAAGLIIQRILKGGDGWVFDCYGLTDGQGKIKTMASHWRIRQYPPDFGITCYGKIPGIPKNDGEEVLFELTEKLLEKVYYHGIFGIEWLQDKETGQFHLLDFNARPFYTIGHLRDCGVNLPMLAYRDLCGDPLSDIPLKPVVKRLLWVDFWPYASTFNRIRKTGRLGWVAWIMSLLGCRSYALWRLSDPGPAWRRTRQAIDMMLGKLFN